MLLIHRDHCSTLWDWSTNNKHAMHIHHLRGSEGACGPGQCSRMWVCYWVACTSNATCMEGGHLLTSFGSCLEADTKGLKP